MTVIFVWLGSAADYGSFGRWLLLVLTVICWVFQYGMLAITKPSQWPAAMAMYVISYIAYGATLVFYAAVFPRLARYVQHVRQAREDLKEGRIEQSEYDTIESLERNHIRYYDPGHLDKVQGRTDFPSVTIALLILISVIFARSCSTLASFCRYRGTAIQTTWLYV